MVLRFTILVRFGPVTAKQITPSDAFDLAFCHTCSCLLLIPLKAVVLRLYCQYDGEGSGEGATISNRLQSEGERGETTFERVVAYVMLWRQSSPRAHLHVAGMSRLCLRHKSTELAHFFLFCSCVCFCLYGPFNCISFHTFSRQLSAFSLCSSGLISVLLVLSAMYIFMKFSLSPNIILCG